MNRTPPPTRLVAIVVASVVLLVAGCGDGSDAATVSFAEPADGVTVAGGLFVKMTAEGITIEPAAEVHAGAEHFHLAADDGCTRPGDTVPRDTDHVHFGAGESEGTIYLEPGRHELCLQAGDGTHVALAATDGLTVNVAITDRPTWCAVINELDRLFEAIDESDDEFAVKKVGYENARRLLAQLDAGSEALDARVRADVSAALAVGTALTTACIDAPDVDAATRAFEEIDRTPVAKGEAHIAEACGVGIDG